MLKRKGLSVLQIVLTVACILAAVVTAAAVCLLIHRKNNEINSLRTMLEVPEPVDETEQYFEPVQVDHHYPLAGYKILLKDQTFGEIWIPVLKDVPLSDHPLEKLKEQDSRMYSYDSDGDYNAMTGIDISSHNQVTDWEAVRDDGIDFVMLRVGYRTYGGGILKEDEKFRQYYQDAKAAGLKVGAYFFSQAVTEEEAVEEAQLTAKQLRDCELDFPVAFDWEIIFDDSDGARTDHVPVDTLTDLTLAFCQNMESIGYRPMIYQNKRTSLLKYDLPRLQGIPFWLAEYGDGPTYIYQYDMWQYTCKGAVNGVEGKVDINLSFLDFSKDGAPEVKIAPQIRTDMTDTQTDVTGTEPQTDSTETTEDERQKEEAEE